MQLRNIAANGRKTINYLKKNGLKHTYYAAKERLEQQREEVYRYVSPSKEELERQRSDREMQENGPTFSILVPAFETKERYLRELLSSVVGQTYEKWELVLVDASTTENVCNVIKEYSFESRIKYIRIDRNEGISSNTNAGLEYCNGDYVCLTDHDDLLTTDALYCMADAAVKNYMPVLIYSDEDKTDQDTTLFYDVHQKYEFNLDLMLSNNYICHLMALKTDVFHMLRERPQFDGAQDYDLVLRTVSFLLKQDIPISKLNSQIIHVPRVLYHWRCHPASTAENTASKGYAYEAGLNALRDFLSEQGWSASVEHSLHLGFYKITYGPDLLGVRDDVGAVGGRLLADNNCMLPCIRDEQGNYLYQGLHKEYSGKMHRFSLRQEVAVIDLRCMKLRESLWPLFERITGVSYRGNQKDGLFDSAWFKQQMQETTGNLPDYEKISEEICQAVRAEGYLIVYDPDLSHTYRGTTICGARRSSRQPAKQGGASSCPHTARRS